MTCGIDALKFHDRHHLSYLRLQSDKHAKAAIRISLDAAPARAFCWLVDCTQTCRAPAFVRDKLWSAATHKSSRSYHHDLAADTFTSSGFRNGDDLELLAHHRLTLRPKRLRMFRIERIRTDTRGDEAKFCIDDEFTDMTVFAVLAADFVRIGNYARPH